MGLGIGRGCNTQPALAHGAGSTTAPPSGRNMATFAAVKNWIEPPATEACPRGAGIS